MRNFERFNPIAVFAYFIAVSVVAMCVTDPMIAVISCIGAITFFIARNGGEEGRTHLLFFGLFVLMCLVNPLLSHKGETVLFFMNDNPVTLESVVYGAVTAVNIIGIIYWFRSFSQIMTSDKLLYLMGSVWPKLALIFSMTLRYIPLLVKQYGLVRKAQKMMGDDGEESIYERITAGIRAFSVMVTWALENGIVTSQSMEARGYGTGRRTFFARYGFRASDGILLGAVLILTGIALGAVLCGKISFTFYPQLSRAEDSLWATVGYVAYAALAAMPTCIEIKEGLKWKYYVSKI